MLFADHNGTTPIPEQVSAAMAPFLHELWANPSSRLTTPGRLVREALEESRAALAQLLHCEPESIVFTSGGTESCFLGLAGCFLGDPQRDHLLISAVEHEAVRQTAAALSQLFPRLEIETVPVSRTGEIDLNFLLDRIRPAKSVVSLMLANNETGVIFPLADVTKLLRAQGVIIHSDAVQAVGKIPVDFPALGVDLLSGSAHKFSGPKGSGFLVIHPQLNKWQTPILGGGQERGRRGGTENVSGIVGMGAAAVMAKQRLVQSRVVEPNLAIPPNERLEQLLKQRLVAISVNGEETVRLPNTTSLTISGILGQELVAELASREIYISAGSACSSTDVRPSHVLVAMGLSTLEAASTVRISTGFEIADGDLERLADGISEAVESIRAEYQKQLEQRIVAG